MDLEIKEKAWEVKDPTYWESPSPDDDWQIVWAPTTSKAKSLCTECDKYLNVQARRVRKRDKVLFEGEIIERNIAEMIIKNRERKEERTKKVMRFGEDEMFYIQNGFVGNCILWWGLGGNGYISDITQAQKYTRSEVLSQFVGGRDEDKIWACSEVDKKIRQTIDHQYLDYSFVS